MCSLEASKRSVFAGMKLSEAKAVCADLQVKEYDSRFYNEAQQELCRQLITCSPKVVSTEPGLIMLDASGLSYLGGEAKLCRIIHKVSAKAGYADVHVGIANSAFAAHVASKFKRRQYYLVPKNGDVDFLSPLSIKQLPISAEMHDSLYELGIRTMGQMVALSEDALVQRFGPEGAKAWSLARGLDKLEPQIPVAEKEFKCSVELGSPIELLHEIQFVLKSMLDRLTKELKQEGLWAEELNLTFLNGDEKFDERPVKLLRPSNHPKFLLEVMKLSLEARPVQREVSGIILSISRFSSESWEQVNIQEVTPQVCESDAKQLVFAAARNNQSSDINEAPKELLALPCSNEASENKKLSLTLMLQRFVSRLGDEAVVRSVPNDQHIPEFAGAWMPVASTPVVNPIVPVNSNHATKFGGTASLASGLALRKCRNPVPVLVEFQGEVPCSISYEGGWYTVKEITHPERLSGLWWVEPIRRSYYVALLEPRKERRASVANSQSINTGGMLVSLVHDHEENGWFLHGFYD
jgi:nucleotidyltransferase/DNA polymerase involved in DNA repair